MLRTSLFRHVPKYRNSVSNKTPSPRMSGVVPVVRLTEVFRQAADSHIITNAHRIRRGQMPDMRGADPSSDFHFVERDDPEKIAATLVKLVQERIPERFRLDPIRDVQVLCPMNRGCSVCAN